MKYVRSFNEGVPSLNSISKGIGGFNKLLLAFMIGYGSINSYKNTSRLKVVYDEINNPQNIPNRNESKQIEEIRNSVINTIKNSDKFNKFGKDFVIDSLKTIEFRLADTLTSADISYGIFINITNLKKYWTSKFFNVPKNENFILIDRDNLYDNNIDNLIFHELYHYYDHLLKDYSTTLDLSKLYDEKFITDKKYALDKLTVFYTGGAARYNDNKDIKEFIDGYYKIIISKKDYFRSTEEVFARWNSMKYKMIQLGLIQNFNDEITPDKIVNLLTDKRVKRKDVSEYVEFIIFMSFSDESIKDLNKIL